MTNKEIHDMRDEIHGAISFMYFSEYTLTDEDVDLCLGTIRRNVADIIEAYKDLQNTYKDLQGRIKELAEKQELSYKEHIKKEYTNII